MKTGGKGAKDTELWLTTAAITARNVDARGMCGILSACLTAEPLERPAYARGVGGVRLPGGPGRVSLRSRWSGRHMREAWEVCVCLAALRGSRRGAAGPLVRVCHVCKCSETWLHQVMTAPPSPSEPRRAHQCGAPASTDNATVMGSNRRIVPRGTDRSVFHTGLLPPNGVDPIPPCPLVTQMPNHAPPNRPLQRLNYDASCLDNSCARPCLWTTGRPDACGTEWHERNANSGGARKLATL